MIKKDIKLFENVADLDDKSLQFLLKALIANNLKEFDYIEFKQAVIKMKEMNIDESTSIKSAFAAGSTVGLSKDSLIQSAERYQKILETEKSAFDEALNAQIENRVKAKYSQAEEAQTQIKVKELEISKLKNEIAQLNEELSNIDVDIKESEDRLKETKTNFETTYTQLKSQIKKDIDHIQNLI